MFTLLELGKLGESDGIADVIVIRFQPNSSRETLKRLCRVRGKILISDDCHTRHCCKLVEELDNGGHAAPIGPNEIPQRLIGEAATRLIAASMLEMVEAGYRDVSRMTRDQHQLPIVKFGWADPDLARAPHCVAGVGEQQPWNPFRRTPKYGKFQQPALVDAELPLVESREHGSNECPSRFREGDDDRVRFAEPGSIAKVAPEPQGGRSRDDSKKLRSGSPRQVPQGSMMMTMH